MEKVKKVHEPLIHITRRNHSLFVSITVRAIALIVALLICGLLVISFTTNKELTFIDVYKSLFDGILKTPRKRWLYLQEIALLLGVALALVPAFKMKFWNLGGNGQILMGCMGCTIVMYYLGGKLPDPVVWIIMILASITAGAIWAVIPAIFKAFFKTNESLFTLMLNYIAVALVSFWISYWYPKGTGAMTPIKVANFPSIGSGEGSKFLLPIIVVTILTIAIYIYLRFSKHGYEISVVGESENTAKYIGINVKKVMIRTMILSGALCGLIGCLLSGAINHSMSSNMDANMGFTGIMVAWLAKFNPFVMVITSAFISFLTRGMSQVNTDFKFTSTALSSVIIGVIYFFIIACEFFINYKIHFKKKQVNEKKGGNA